MQTQTPTQQPEQPQARPIERREPERGELYEVAMGAAPVLFAGLVALLLIAGAVALSRATPGGAGALAGALLGEHTFWYMSRASALVSYALLWWSMVLGITITNRMARVWPGGPTVSDLHEHASLLGLLLGAVHALVLVGDRYIGYSLADVLVPFAGQTYRPLWVGLGQVALYLLVPVTLTFYVRRAIGGRAWRLIHYASFGAFALALIHGVMSGTDSGAGWATWLYVLTGLSVLGLTVDRVVTGARRSAA